MKDGESPAVVSKSPIKAKGKVKKEKNGELEAEESSRVLENEDQEFEKKLQEAQTERLIKKLQAMTKKVQDLEKENDRYTFLDQVLRRSLKIGNIRISSHIKHDLDITRLTIEDLENEFHFEEKLLIVSSTSLSFESRKIDKGQSQGPGKPGDEYKITLDDVEYISFVEKPGSNFYLIRAIEGDKNSKIKSQDSIRGSNSAKASPFENKLGFYILQVEDQREIVAWELAFFMFNFKILARNISSSYNRRGFLQSLKIFLSRYDEYGGENPQIFGESSPVLNIGGSHSGGKLALNPMLSSVNSLSSPQSTASPAFPKQTATFDFMQESPLDLNRSSKPGPTPLMTKLQTLMKGRSEEVEVKQVSSSQNRKSSLRQKTPLLKQSVPLEEEVEEDEQLEQKEWNERKMQRELKEQRDQKEQREQREQREQKEQREQREQREFRDQRERTEEREYKAGTEHKEQQEQRESEEAVSDQSQAVEEYEKQNEEIASLEEEFSPEENKSNISNQSNAKKEKKSAPEVEEQPPFTKAINTLLEGTAFEKYGKWGGKNEKLIRISNDFVGIEWKDPKKPRQVPDSITIESVERLELGSRSTYFMKKKLPDAELNLCFSIISSEKSLHLKAPDQRKKEAFIESLQLALNDKIKLRKMSALLTAPKGKSGADK